MHIIDKIIDSREYLAQLLPFTTLHIAFCNAFLFWNNYDFLDAVFVFLFRTIILFLNLHVSLGTTFKVLLFLFFPLNADRHQMGVAKTNN